MGEWQTVRRFDPVKNPEWDICHGCNYLTRPAIMWTLDDGDVVPLCDECEEGLHGEG